MLPTWKGPDSLTDRLCCSFSTFLLRFLSPQNQYLRPVTGPGYHQPVQPSVKTQIVMETALSKHPFLSASLLQINANLPYSRMTICLSRKLKALE